MIIARIFQPSDLALHTILPLHEGAAHHVSRVLRAKVGDHLILFNGQGGEYTAVIVEITKKAVLVELRSFSLREVESPLELYLAQGISRGEKMDYTIQKAVELGVKKVIPLLTERCNVKLDAERRDKRWQHWRAIAIGACEQSGRNRVPDILAPQTFVSFVKTVEADCKLLLTPEASPMVKEFVKQTHRVVLLIGPEGGLSKEEIEIAIAHQFQAISLGPRILRTETAAVVALAVLQNLAGDLGAAPAFCP